MIGLVLRPLGACGLALLAPRPAAPVVSLGAASAVLGVAIGPLLFAVLARGRALPLRARIGARRRAIRCAWLAGVAAWEEALYRGLVLGIGSTAIGTPAAFVVATGAFALAHANQGRRAALQLVTGSAFGLTYVASGSLAAAVVAHAAYDLLVDARELAARTRPLETVVPGASSSYRHRNGMAVGTTRSGTRPGAAAPAGAVASLVDVRRRFGQVEALAGVTLAIEPGEVVALLGPNGAGKTTAVSILLGLRRADGGEVALFGRSPARPAARRAVGTVLQESAFPPALRVHDVLDLVRAHFRDPVPADELLDRFALAPLARRQVGGLSGGERRRLGLAAALAGRPRLLVLDEPTAGVDVEARRSMWEVVREFAAGGGAVLLTTHQLDEADRLATRVTMLARGRVVAEGTPTELRSRVGLTTIRFVAPALPPGLERETVVVDGERVTVTTDRPEHVLEQLVREGTALTGLEVSPVSLEEAFLELTSERP